MDRSCSVGGWIEDRGTVKARSRLIPQSIITKHLDSYFQKIQKLQKRSFG